MPDQAVFTKNRKIPRRWGLFAIYLFYAAIFLRTFIMMEDSGHTWPYLIANVVLILFFTIVMIRPTLPDFWLHFSAFAMMTLIVYIQTLEPEEDPANALFVIVGYLVGFSFTGRLRWIWAAVLAFVCSLSLSLNMGIEGFGKSLLNVAGILMMVAYFAINQEIDEAREKSQVMLVELEETHKKLEVYASQVEELSAMQERNRLARELHDSVSQTMFSIILNTRAAQMLATRDPGRLLPQLNLLQTLSQNALLEMRSLIAELRPKKE